MLLKSLLGTGAVDGNLAEGDLVELGFFDTDLSASISPNTDSSNLFEGTWTALSSITKIGEDWDSSSDVGTGEFSLLPYLKMILTLREQGKRQSQ